MQATRVHEDIFDRSIDVQVLRLRRKLEIDPSAPRAIQTERGVGYVFALPVEPVLKNDETVAPQTTVVTVFSQLVTNPTTRVD